MKEHTRRFLFWICIVICAACLVYIGHYYLKKEKNHGVYEKIQEEAERQKKPVVKRALENVKKEEEEDMPIDFASLKETNEDIYAWIDVPNTNIHYPIVQSASDDSYYLNHTIEGKEGYPGSIYTESGNAKDFSDFNTVIYGHDMLDGTMFKDLHKFENPDFFQENDKVIIYTETEKKTYQIFAAVVYDERHLLYSFNNEVKEDRKAFLQSIYESQNIVNQIRYDVPVDENSHIITLSTCIGSQPDKRFLVEAVELDE